jgi:hypothetical protein
MSAKTEAWTILIAVLVLSAGGYTIAWRSHRMWLRRIAALMVGLLAGVAACAATFGSALPVLREFDPTRLAISSREPSIINALTFAFCFAAWFLTVRLLLFAIRPRRNS